MAMTPRQKKTRQAILSLAHQDFVKTLNSHAFFKVHDHEIGEDLVQDTFLKTWKYLVSGGKVDTMKAFLFHVLNHLIVDEYRKQNHKATSLEVLIEQGFEPSVDPMDQLFNVLDGKAAMLLIEKLPKNYQNIMRLRYVKDLSLQEISLIVGQSKNTVAVKIHRGLAKLRVIYNRK